MQIDRERLAAASRNKRCAYAGMEPPRVDHMIADAILAEIAAQGFVIVPRAPTEAMIDRFVSRALNVSVHGDGGWSNYAREQWAVMLKAAEGEG